MKLIEVASCYQEGWIEVLIDDKKIYRYSADAASIHRFRDMLKNPYCNKGRALAYLKKASTSTERR